VCWPEIVFAFTDGSYTKGTRAHTHRELIREWISGRVNPRVNPGVNPKLVCAVCVCVCDLFLFVQGTRANLTRRSTLGVSVAYSCFTYLSVCLCESDIHRVYMCVCVCVLTRDRVHIHRRFIIKGDTSTGAARLCVCACFCPRRLPA